jgi:hypothetical protein
MYDLSLQRRKSITTTPKIDTDVNQLVRLGKVLFVHEDYLSHLNGPASCFVYGLCAQDKKSSNNDEW